MLKELAFSGVILISSSSASLAQDYTCDRKLSVLEADILDLSGELEESLAKIVRTSEAFAKDELRAQRSLACPDGIPQRLKDHRTAVETLTHEDLTTQANADLQCTQFFGQRITADLKKAEAAGNAAMVQKLSAISERISSLDTSATKHASEAVFQMSKKKRLLQGIDALNALCGDLGDIYD